MEDWGDDDDHAALSLWLVAYNCLSFGSVLDVSRDRITRRTKKVGISGRPLSTVDAFEWIEPLTR